MSCWNMGSGALKIDIDIVTCSIVAYHKVNPFTHDHLTINTSLDDIIFGDIFLQ